MAVTLYVNADSDDRSDAWTYEQASDDPTKPFATMQAAAMLLASGDTMQVEPSTLGNASPAIMVDPDVYEGVNSNGNTVILPAARNNEGDTIHVVGHIVDDVIPKCLGFDFYQVDNWDFSTFQKGFDRGSGADHLTISGLQDCSNLTFTSIFSTGGGWRCIAGSGLLRWFACHTWSPFLDGNSNFTNGMGFNIIGENTSTGVNTTGDWEFEECFWEQVEGEDCIQCSLGNPAAEDEATRGGTLKVLNCIFKDIVLNPALTSPPHTDCIQLLGVRDAKIWGNRFKNVIQPLIASDHMNGRISMLNNLVDGAQNGLWVQGTQVAVWVHNTIKGLFSGIAVGNRLQETIPDFTTKLIAVNNVVTSIQVDGGTNVDPESIVKNNVCYLAPGQVTDWGTQLEGFTEFGPSTRLATDGLVEGDVSDWGDPSGRLELSNSPVETVGVGDGCALADLGLTEEEIDYLESDVYGRAYADPRDCGALQGDPGTLIEPAPRPPYVLDRHPASDSSGIDLNTGVTFTLVPPPGQEIDPATITTTSVYVADATAFIHLPARVTLGPLVDGAQLVTLDLFMSLDPELEGELFPLVLYTVAVEGVADTQGSEITSLRWSFRVAGTGQAAIRPVSGASGTYMSGGFLRDFITGALVVVAQ